jgi:crotonobetainyl-CoA:carnitine CoA-transferase CaiB-like acyl-CoA transferase
VATPSAPCPLRHLSRRFPEEFPVDRSLALLQAPTLQYQPVLTQDRRWVQLANLMEHLFHTFIAAMSLTEVYAEPRFAGVPALPEAEKDAVHTLMLRRMRERDYDEWQALFLADGDIAAEPIVSIQEALDHPQAAPIGLVIDVDHPGLGPMRQIGPIARFSSTPACLSATSPEIDEHAPPAARLAANGAAYTSAASAHASGRLPRHPLERVTVVEFASIIAVPYACILLADLGARD